VTPASRNVWLELTAFGLFLLSLVLFLAAEYATAMFIVHSLLPNEKPIEMHGVIFTRHEALVGALSTSLPGIALIAAAWGLRSLLAEEGEGKN
jgi:hypothetical protein